MLSLLYFVTVGGPIAQFARMIRDLHYVRVFKIRSRGVVEV
jgi:hypothetical protein